MKKTKRIPALLIAVLILIFSAFSAFGAKAPEGVCLSVLGDSIASGYGLDDIHQSYASLISDEKNYTLSNNAVPGHTTSDLLRVVCHEEEAREGLKKADLVIISIGGNDILHLLGNADTATLLDIISKGIESQYIKAAMQSAKEKLLYSCTEIRTLNPDAPIIIQTQYNSLYAHEQYKQFAALADKLAPAFTQIIDYVSQEISSIYTADIYTAFDNYYKVNQSYDIIQPDGIHPSVIGHRLIAQVILAEIEKLEDAGLVEKAPKFYYLLGDTDATGTVTISDATIIQKCIARKGEFTNSIARLCADTDGDGIVTIKDATLIQKHLAMLATDSKIDTYIPYFPE